METAQDNICEQATLSSKGQVTLPKSIRQALAVTTGSKLTFRLRGDEVVVARADQDHTDPAIGAFLQLLEQNIQTGRHVSSLPEGLRASMEQHAIEAVGGEDIEGDVAL